MIELKRISGDGVNCALYSARGEVVGASKWTTLEVSGGGGGSSTRQAITSKTTEHDQFFLRLQSGEERPVRLADVSLSLRDGQDVTVVWGIKAGQNEGPVLAVINHTTGEQTRVESAIQTLAEAMGCWTLGLGVVVMAGGVIYSLAWLFLGGDSPFIQRVLLIGACAFAAWFSARYLWNRARRTTDALNEIRAGLDAAMPSRT